MRKSTGRLSEKMMKYVFFSIEEVENEEDWQVLLHDDRAPKKIMSGRAYLVLVATMLKAGRRDEIKEFENLLIRHIDNTILVLPAMERGRMWRTIENQLIFIN